MGFTSPPFLDKKATFLICMYYIFSKVKCLNVFDFSDEIYCMHLDEILIILFQVLTRIMNIQNLISSNKILA
jgi:hypothetical protein